MATSVTPRRHVRPNVSDTITPTDTPPEHGAHLYEVREGATTNNPEALDPAINNRPGRFDLVLAIAAPGEALRRRCEQEPELLQHGPRYPAGEYITREQQDGQPVDGGRGRAGEHVGGAGPNGRRARQG